MICRTCGDWGEVEKCTCPILPDPTVRFHRHPPTYVACPDCDQLPLRLLKERDREASYLDRRVRELTAQRDSLQALVPRRETNADGEIVWRMVPVLTKARPPATRNG